MDSWASDWLDSVYSWLEAFQISPSTLAGAMLFLALAFLFASREAAAWFLKTHDLKRDLVRLEELILQLEGQIRSLRESVERASPPGAPSVAPSKASADPEARPAPENQPGVTAAISATAKPRTFNLSH